ncbi:MAG: N-acetylglucosamine kinase [Tunicatimonas sp.]
MILIADSGSTKTDWRVIDRDGKIHQAKTVGLNPYHQSSDDIAQVLDQKLLPQLIVPVEQVWFYGSGCANPAANQTAAGALKSVFPQAEIEVASDLLAAARALCGHEPGIACILGTGANSCLYDGSQITDNVPPLGYVLGDEGSGTYIGKELLNRYLKRDMPEPLRSQFAKRYSLTTEDVLENVYRQPQANTYLASFAKFAFHHLKHPYIVRMVYEGFGQFFEKNVAKYEDYQQHKIHFTGSIAFYYSNVLRQVANDLNFIVQNIVESPIAGLTLYHQS